MSDNRFSHIFKVTRNYGGTRELGRIPGCVPAVDVLIERELSQVQYYNLSKVGEYRSALRDEGKWPQPLTFLKNPSKPYRNPYT